MQALADQAHAAGALLVVYADAMSMAMFTPPGEYGADIVASEGQALGVPPTFGGPYVGIFACKQSHIRQMPGRIVGRTVDTQGRTAYVLTLQTREQHIRRERATSNICTSVALIALMTTVYMAANGRHGMRQTAELTYQKSHYLASLMTTFRDTQWLMEAYSSRSSRYSALHLPLSEQPPARLQDYWRLGHKRPGGKRHACLCHRGQHSRGD